MSETIYICTFHKCGSNWFRDIFYYIASNKGYAYEHIPSSETRFGQPLEGNAPKCVILSVGSRQAFAQHCKDQANARIVFCLRDPRDAIVSQYFSWKFSHQNNSAVIMDARQRFEEMSEKEGILYLIENKQISYLNHLSGWEDILTTPDWRVHIMKYEAMTYDFDREINMASLVCGFSLDQSDIDGAYNETKFSRKVKRSPGEEDKKSHYRKGTAGDHKNYFDEKAYEALAKSYGREIALLNYRF
jgi:hypothetical protein